MSSFYKYKSQDPSVKYYSEIITNEILEYLHVKLDKDTRRIYHIGPRTNLGQELAHAVIRLLASRLMQRVNNIDQLEKDAEDLRNFIDSGG